MLEIACIIEILQWRLPRHSGFSKILPIDLSEPCVSSNLLTFVLGSQSFGWVGIEQMDDKMASSEAKKIGKFDYSFEDFFIDVSRLVIVIEGWVAC